MNLQIVVVLLSVVCVAFGQTGMYGKGVYGEDNGPKFANAQDVATGLWLTVNSDGKVVTSATRPSSQKWLFGPLLSNTGFSSFVTISYQDTSKLLDSNTDGEVYLHDGNGGLYQRWNITAENGVATKVVNCATGLALDSNSDGKVYTHVLNGGDYQKWNLNA